MACKHDFMKMSVPQLLAWDAYRTIDIIFNIRCGKKLRKALLAKQRADTEKLLGVSSTVKEEEQHLYNPDYNKVVTKGDIKLLQAKYRAKKRKEDNIEKLLKQCSCT